MTSFSFNAWMWAHPDLFAVGVCGSFAIASLAIFVCVRKLAGGPPTDDK